MKKSGKKRTRLAKIVFILWLPFVMLVAGIITYRNVKNSLFFSHTDKVRIVLYGKQTTFLSLGLRDNVSYRIIYPADLKIVVPGGYGFYRIGALGKLQALQNDLTLIQRSFSQATSTMVQYYFVFPENDIFYGNNTDSSSIISQIKLFMTGTSNASFLDRIYLTLFFAQKKETVWKDLSLIEVQKEGESILDQEATTRKWQGYLFDAAIRRENATIQVLYTSSFEAAQSVASILDGSGVRVSDVQSKPSKPASCLLTVGNTSLMQSVTVVSLQTFFHCPIETGNTGIYDILFSIGGIEKNWK